LEYYNYTQQEIALTCASHHSSRAHLDVVQGLQSKIGISEDQLQCGSHSPHDPEIFHSLYQQQRQPTANNNNCSGKHTSMLAHAKMEGFILDNYLDPTHPVQVRILDTLADMCKISKEKIALGIDGCSAPNFALPLYNIALGVARLCDPVDCDEARTVACKKITSAMMDCPEMVAAHGDFDSEVMRVGNKRLVSKKGAEGLLVLGLMPGTLPNESRGIGIVVKIADGDRSGTVRPAVMTQILSQLGVFKEHELKELESFGPTVTLRNCMGRVVGSSFPCFTFPVLI